VTPDVAYFVFGSVLVAALAAIIAFYYSKKRKAHVEQAKFKMLDDDE
jgi:cbb3-type cytochrome oxidase subunit 3